MVERRDGGSFDEVVLPHLDAAYNLARWLARNGPDAEDIVQAAMVRALIYYPSFRGTNARAWILQIVRNVAITSLQQKAQMLQLQEAGSFADESEGSLGQLSDPSDGPEAALAKVQDIELLNVLLGELSVELRECLILRELEKLSYGDIAHVTGAPVGTVMSRLWRARRTLIKLAAKGER